ncbi:MAG: YkvA family protein [Chloroflexota bacterium]|nr:YkvA family protein [Chloroflexota bacterium]
METWRSRARRLKDLVYALYVVYQDPRTPWYVRAVAFGVVGYALSPIDLIPDFIPILGYLDDLVLIPLGVALVIRLIPANVWLQAQAKAATMGRSGTSAGRIVAAFIIIAIWLLTAAIGWLAIRRWW